MRITEGADGQANEDGQQINKTHVAGSREPRLSVPTVIWFQLFDVSVVDTRHIGFDVLSNSIGGYGYGLRKLLSVVIPKGRIRRPAVKALLVGRIVTARPPPVRINTIRRIGTYPAHASDINIYTHFVNVHFITHMTIYKQGLLLSIRKEGQYTAYSHRTE